MPSNELKTLIDNRLIDIFSDPAFFKGCDKDRLEMLIKLKTALELEGINKNLSVLNSTLERKLSELGFDLNADGQIMGIECLGAPDYSSSLEDISVIANILENVAKYYISK